MRLTPLRGWLVLYVHRAMLLPLFERQPHDAGSNNASEGGELLTQRRGPSGRQAIGMTAVLGGKRLDPALLLQAHERAVERAWLKTVPLKRPMSSIMA